MAAAERYIDRFTGEELFDEYAWDLMAAMQEQLHANYRPDYGRAYSIQNLREKAFITREGVSSLKNNLPKFFPPSLFSLSLTAKMTRG